MPRLFLNLLLTTLFLALAPIRSFAAGYTLTILDDPAAGNQKDEGTIAIRISGNFILGDYIDNQKSMHGFIYNMQTRRYTTFNGPQSRTYVYLVGVWSNAIIGYYFDNIDNPHSFIYDQKMRKYTFFDDLLRKYLPSTEPDVLLLENIEGSAITGISDNNVCGIYLVSSSENGFVYDLQSHKFMLINNPSAAPGTTDHYGVQGTHISAISEKVIVGRYTDSNFVIHGFIYDRMTHKFTTLDVPQSVTGKKWGGTYVVGMSGPTIFGWYSGDTFHGSRGFIYDRGDFTTLSYPQAMNTHVGGISGNRVLGMYVDDNGAIHGFVYDAKSMKFTNLDDLLAENTKYQSDFIPEAISGDTIVGRYIDNSGVFHGFIATPK
ncbi:MAG TPA: hypothetical protein VMG59_01235 [Phycisphaerae bacterium]|nr:hypothetical protein [Phycisphaerae bacterium]